MSTLPAPAAVCLWAIVCQGLRCSWRSLVLCLSVGLLLGGLPTSHAYAESAVRSFTVADVSVDQGGLTPPGSQARWVPARLPHIWKETHPGFEGTMWYRLELDLAEVPTKPWAVYIPRVVTNAQVWINGAPLAYTGSMAEPVTRNWYVPLLTPIQPSMMRVGRNDIHIRVATGFVTRAGLSAVQVGPQHELTGPYTTRLWLQIDGANVASVGVLALGLMMLIVWLRDREQTAVGYMGLASVIWGLHVLSVIAPNPWSEVKLWEDISYVLSVVSCFLLALFMFRFCGSAKRWRDLLILVCMAAASVVGVVQQNHALNTGFYALAYLMSVWATVDGMWRTLSGRRQDGHWLWLGAVPVLVAGGHDIMIMQGLLPFEEIYCVYYAVPFMMACIAVMVAGDYARSRRALRDLNYTLADRINERERALRESFEQLSVLERARAVSDERSRILKDMHDGVGTHLASALRQLQSPSADAVDVPLVAQTLRDSLDQLKLSIDALSLVPGDVAGLLASWRFRLAPRLKAAGIDLVWDVEPLPAWPQGQSPSLRQLQYILFEGLSNVLQHAQASRLVLSARDLGHTIRISLIDNGHGWRRTEAQEGQGLQTMRGRALAIGAMLEFVPAANGGLELRLSLPVSDQASHTHLSSAA